MDQGDIIIFYPPPYLCFTITQQSLVYIQSDYSNDHKLQTRTNRLLPLGKKWPGWSSVLQRVVNVLNFDKVNYPNTKAIYSAYYASVNSETVVLPSHSGFFKYTVGQSVQVNLSKLVRKDITFKWSLYGGKTSRYKSLKGKVSSINMFVKILIVYTFPFNTGLSFHTFLYLVTYPSLFRQTHSDVSTFL